MFRYDLIRAEDMSALLRLIGEVTELPADKRIRRTHVVSGLLKMVGGCSATAMELALPHEGPLARPGTVIAINPSSEAERRMTEIYLVSDSPPDPAIPECIAARGQTITMDRQIGDREWYGSDHYNLVRRPLGIDHSLYCRLTLPDGNDFGVGLQRRIGDRRFSDREKAIVHLLHTNAPHVYSVRDAVRGEFDRLAPRLQPVFRYLLQGDAEKEVAAKLALSRHTVHRYTQAIYEELEVHSRGELLAKYARWA